MAFLIGVGHLLVLATVLFQDTTSLPVLNRNQDDVEGLFTSVLGESDVSLLARNLNSLVEAKRGLSEEVGLSTRQLGDIEFSNNYAEYLRSKAKLTTICSFLRRIQSVKKSRTAADVEKVNQLLKQYMCPAVNQWMPDL